MRKLFRKAVIRMKLDEIQCLVSTWQIIAPKLIMTSIIYFISYRLEKQPRKTALPPQRYKNKELECLDANRSRSGPVSTI